MKDNISIVIRGGRVFIKIWLQKGIAIMAPCKSLRQAIHMANEYYEHFVPYSSFSRSIDYWESVGAFL